MEDKEISTLCLITYMWKEEKNMIRRDRIARKGNKIDSPRDH